MKNKKNFLVPENQLRLTYKTKIVKPDIQFTLKISTEVYPFPSFVYLTESQYNVFGVMQS